MARELYYTDKNGKRQDASLHEPILAGGPRHVDHVVIDIAIACGLTPEERASLYGGLK